MRIVHCRLFKNVICFAQAQPQSAVNLESVSPNTEHIEMVRIGHDQDYSSLG